MTESVTNPTSVDMLSSLSLGQPNWWWPALVLLMVALMVLIWGYRQPGQSDALRKTAFCMKLLAITLITACLLEPLWTSPTAKLGANVVVVLADNSRGMTIAETVGRPSRGETQSKIISDGALGWQKNLDDGFDVRRYTFDASLTRSVDLVSDLNYQGPSSDLGAALKEIASRYHNHSLAAVVILSDGAATDLTGPLDLAGLPPIYTLPIGSDDIGTDLAISDVTVVTTNFEDSPVTVHAEIHANGLNGRRALVRLTDATGKLIEQQHVDITNPEHHGKLRFNVHPKQEGVVFYHLEILTDEQPNATPVKEATTANNRKTIVVDRGQGPYRILYVSGRPNWEYKFLHRALEEDEQVKLVGLIRIAKREPKFEWSGRAGDKSNPLFTGIKTNDEEATYDKPILVRLNVADKDELADGFPKTADLLYAYHAIILDDVEAAFFTRDQMELIQRYVSERGGGLMMLGGAESLDAGNYDHTPIGDALPIYTRTTQHGSPLGGVHLELSREGLLQPWARLRDQAEAENKRLASLPTFDVVNYSSNIKPGANLLATARTSSGQSLPALVTHRYGKGRAVVFTIGDYWRAGLSMDPTKTEDLSRFWRQTLRWLIADVPGRVELSINTAAGAKRPTELRLRVTDQAFKPIDNADTSIVITPPTGAPINLSAEPTSDAPGEFQAVYLASDPGAYRITATAKSSDGQIIGGAEAGLVVDPDAKEFSSIKPNRAVLEQLAKQTGGRVLSKSDLSGLADELLNREAPIMESKTSPLWHNGWLLSFIIALLVGEWILRRKRGMA